MQCWKGVGEKQRQRLDQLAWSEKAIHTGSGRTFLLEAVVIIRTGLPSEGTGKGCPSVAGYPTLQVHCGRSE